LILILQLQTPCRQATQNNEGESMTPITKNEKLTIWQKIFAGRVTFSGRNEGELTSPASISAVPPSDHWQQSDSEQ